MQRAASPDLIVPESDSTEASSEKAVEVRDNPRLGVLWYIIYTLKMTSILYITKGLYHLNPDLQVLQVTSMKALISVVILAVSLNKNIKYVMYDRVDPDSVYALAFKSSQTCASILIQYNAMKYFSVSTTSVVCSLTPLVACLLATLILREQLTRWTVVSVLIVLSCVSLIIFGAQGEEKAAMHANTLAVVALCAQPLLLAGGMIASRKMKKNHPMAQACYTNVLLGVVSLLAVQCSGNVDFAFLEHFSPASWLLIFFAGLFTIFENTAKFMAFRYEEAAKLQKLAFLPNVWNFAVDQLAFHLSFSSLQLVGFAFLFGFYTYELVTFYFCRQHEQPPSEARKGGAAARSKSTNEDASSQKTGAGDYTRAPHLH